MPKSLDPKCQLCAKLPTTQAKLLHGPQGDGCWNPKVCHNRRSFYRHRSQNNSAEIDAIAVEPPATYFAVLYLYKESGDKPLHALGAELWLGQKPVCRLEAIHCFGLTAGKIRAYTDQVLQAFARQYGVYYINIRICLRLPQVTAQCVLARYIQNPRDDHIPPINHLGCIR